jgi:DNA-binding NarL/FixJ family response regulator
LTPSLIASERTVEAHVRRILMKLDIPQSDDSHRRVLAVLAQLSAVEAGTGTQP